MRIYLIGFMGSGKTYIGKQLATSLGLAFIDLDQYLQEREGQSIVQIFENQGEDRFRELERKYLHETADLHRFVIATGGGTPCFFNNITWMNNHGITIYLQTREDILAARLNRKKYKRPLIANKSDEEIEDFITKKLAERRPYYESAHLTIDRKTFQDDLVVVLSKFFRSRFIL